jgi:hypothetical protein
MLARMSAFDIADFTKECSWYKGKSTKKLLDGYRIFPRDPWAAENGLIETFLKKDFYKLREWQPTAIETLAPEKKIRLIQAMLVHLAMMGTGERCTPAEVKAMKGETSMNYDLKLSHFIRDFSKEWLKGDVPFTEADLAACLRVLTYLNYNATDTAPYPTDVIQRHNLYPFKQLFKHVTNFAKKNRDTPVLILALRDFRGSLVWHAKKRTSEEQKLAKDLLDKVDAILRPR